MGTFTFDGLAVHYLDEGAGYRAVVFVHGFPFQSSMWEPQIPVAVGAGRRVVVPDLPGFGRSDVPAERSAYSIDRYADLVAAMIQHLSLGRVVLVGLAMGGYITLAVARRHPGVLAGLVLADTKAIPGGRLEVVSDAGHVANLENPDVFNRVLAEFLATT